MITCQRSHCCLVPLHELEIAYIEWQIVCYGNSFIFIHVLTNTLTVFLKLNKLSLKFGINLSKELREEKIKCLLLTYEQTYTLSFHGLKFVLNYFFPLFKGIAQQL